MSIIGKVKELFGLGCELNALEATVIEVVRESLPQRLKFILDDQISHFNRVSRVLVNDDRLGHGDTLFYWMRNGKSQFDYPEKFDVNGQEEKLAEVEIKCDDGNVIFASLIMVNGVFCNIQYRSSRNEYKPRGRYGARLVYLNSSFERR